jgi:hypothetical protein
MRYKERCHHRAVAAPAAADRREPLFPVLIKMHSPKAEATARNSREKRATKLFFMVDNGTVCRRNALVASIAAVADGADDGEKAPHHPSNVRQSQ